MLILFIILISIAATACEKRVSTSIINASKHNTVNYLKEELPQWLACGSTSNAEYCWRFESGGILYLDNINRSYNSRGEWRIPEDGKLCINLGPLASVGSVHDYCLFIVIDQNLFVAYHEYGDRWSAKFTSRKGHPRYVR